MISHGHPIAPTPSAILAQYVADADVYPPHLFATVRSASAGFVIGNVVAVLAAITFCRFPIAERLFRGVNITFSAIDAAVDPATLYAVSYKRQGVTMVTALDRSQRVLESRRKFHPPFALDESLCLYSPQDNVEALEHPRVRDGFDFIEGRYRPDLPDSRRTVLLMLPCAKTKPYVLSLEHMCIDAALRQAGFAPVGRSNLASELEKAVPPEFPCDVIVLGPLRNSDGLVIHRAVISEPLAFVPYEHMLTYEDKGSPACAYDDPGVFENRGNAVSPWRADFSGEAVGKRRWRWGVRQRAAYVAMYNAMAKRLAAVLTKLAPLYDERIAWVAPGLTHRSFALAKEERRAHRVPTSNAVGDARLKLTGANDLLALEDRVRVSADGCSMRRCAGAARRAARPRRLARRRRRDAACLA